MRLFHAIIYLSKQLHHIVIGSLCALNHWRYVLFVQSFQVPLQLFGLLLYDLFCYFPVRIHHNRWRRYGRWRPEKVENRRLRRLRFVRLVGAIRSHAHVQVQLLLARASSLLSSHSLHLHLRHLQLRLHVFKFLATIKFLLLSPSAPFAASNV